MPRRNTMSPPELSRNAPVPDVSHPLKVDVRILRRHEDGTSLFHGCHRRLSERLYLNEPLSRQNRFHYRAATLTMADVIDEWLGSREQALRVQIFQNAFSRFSTFQARIGAAGRGDFRIFANDADLVEIVTLPHIE